MPATKPLPMRCVHAFSAALALSVFHGATRADEFNLRGSVGAEVRVFPQSPQFAQQQRALNGSGFFAPELSYEWEQGKQSIVFSPFARIDEGDARRTHVDIRELAWVKAAAAWELRVGIRRVFWGVAESNHLVDIINQTDLVENIDTEDKLGQPMVNLALIRDWGTVDLFVLPSFRERRFPGKSGRFRTQPRVDTSSTSYESAAGDKHVDYAIRYSNVIGALDFGLYHFWGTSREPRLLPGRTHAGEIILLPRYDLIHQTGLDALYTVGSWAWKLEALHRVDQGDSFSAMVGGFEYTRVGVLGSAYDLGLLMEYHGDDRGRHSPQPFNHDLFVGARVGFNDIASTQLLTGVVADLYGGGRFFNLEFSTRFGERWKLEVEARTFWSAPLSDPLHFLERDDYLQLQLERFF